MNFGVNSYKWKHHTIQMKGQNKIMYMVMYNEEGKCKLTIEVMTPLKEGNSC